jgi:hypothetical protein
VAATTSHGGCRRQIETDAWVSSASFHPRPGGAGLCREPQRRLLQLMVGMRASSISAPLSAYMAPRTALGIRSPNRISMPVADISNQ